MPLTREQTRALVAQVADTRNDEIVCDECMTGMAEFAECQLVGATPRSAMSRIEAHLASCPDCSEEFELLLEALRGAGRT